ncbi:MAG: helix-turn-helix transcriptional regulator [Candidatus Acidiferrum sp.]
MAWTVDFYEDAQESREIEEALHGLKGAAMATRLDRYFKRQMQDPEMRKLVERELAHLEVGIQIARLREEQNLNQTQLAARAGMNASKISLIETSPKNVTLGTLARLARALNRRIKIDFVPMRGKGTGAV